MIEVYLINGTGGEFEDDYEDNLSKYINLLEELSEQECFTFECSLDEDISPVKKKAKELLRKLENKSQVEDIRICFIHKNDVEDLLGIKSLFKSLINRSGLNCRIVTGGTIRNGDTVRPL